MMEAGKTAALVKSKDGQEFVKGMDDGKVKGYTTVMETKEG